MVPCSMTTVILDARKSTHTGLSQPFSKSVYFPLAYNQKVITFAIKVKKNPKDWLQASAS